MRYPNVTSLYFATPLEFNAPTEGFPGDDLRKILHGGQRMPKVQNGEEIVTKVSTPRVRHRHINVRPTEDRRICDSNDPNVT